MFAFELRFSGLVFCLYCTEPMGTTGSKTRTKRWTHSQRVVKLAGARQDLNAIRSERLYRRLLSLSKILSF